MTDRHVLIVDDHPINRRLPEVILRDAGWLTDEAENGEQALAKLAAGSFEVVLLDISMPGMSGEEVCRRIRADEHLKHLRVIAYTAHAIEESRPALVQAGFDWLLIKPISRQSLLEAIDPPNTTGDRPRP
jgi:two-component system, chemotaxis family, chemotaxis protein CheY